MTNQEKNEAPILEVEHLRVRLVTPDAAVYPVQDVCWHVDAGEMLAVVGESGCGKTSSLRALTRLFPDSDRFSVEGNIRFCGLDISAATAHELRSLRGKSIGMIFQNAQDALDPTMRCGRQLELILRTHFPMTHREARTEAVKILRRAGLADAERVYRRYPHELSGGMAQRVMIAAALACHPPLLLADEPTSALDVTVKLQIMQLLRSAQQSMRLAVVLVTHDLAAVSSFANRVAVMYAGRIVETGTRDEIFQTARHPYTLGLLAAIPAVNRPSGSGVRGIPGKPPLPDSIHTGCAFAPRCPRATAVCAQAVPEAVQLSGTHAVSCHALRKETLTGGEA